MLIFLLINWSSLTLRGSIIDTSGVKKRHHHKQQAQTGSDFTIGSLGLRSTADTHVEQEGRAQQAILQKGRIYNPGTTNLIQGRGINIDKADLDKYFPNGVNLYLTDAQIQAQIDELKKEELYKEIGIGMALLTLGGCAGYYFRSRPTKKKLL